MTFLPIVDRELREGARRNSTRYIRLIVAAVALVISLFQLAIMPLMMGLGRTSGSAGFGFMTGYAFVLCLLAGIFVTADCLSEEKREGTLGLLFLTDLRGYDVVLGKLASQFVHFGYGLLAIIPAAALPMLFGGVTGGELWRISLALVNLLFFSLATGIFASSVSRQAGRAMMLTAMTLAVVCFLLPALQSLLSWGGVGGSAAWVSWISPAAAYRWADESSFTLRPDRFWIALGASHIGAWFLIGFASWWLPRSWQDKPVKARKSTLLDRFGTGASTARVRRRRELLDHEPLRWLIGEQWSARIITWGVAILWALGMMAVAYFQRWEALIILAVYGRILLLPIKLLFAAQATRFFVESRRTGAFELLLAAPLGSRDLVTAQWAMLRRVFLPPILLIVGSTIVAALFVGLAGNDGLAPRVFGLGFAGVIGLVSFGEWILDFFALGALGMWLALTMRKPHLATGATILFVLILPSFMCGIGFIVDIILIAVFLNKLHGDFRPLVLAQPGLASGTAAGARP